jgi:PAS domain S-box-containing protein
MDMLRYYFGQIGRLGLRPEIFWKIQRDVQSLNYSSLTAASVTILSAIGVYMAFPGKLYWLVVLLFGLSYLSTLLFNYLQWYKLAKFIPFLIVNSYIFWGSSTFGYESLIHFLLILAIFGAALNYDTAEPIAFSIVILMPVALLAGLYYTDFSLWKDTSLAAHEIKILADLTCTFAFLSAGVLSVIYVKSNEKHQKALVANNKEISALNQHLQKSNELQESFFNQSLDTILIVDPHTKKVVACNHQAVPAFQAGTKDEDIWGQDFTHFLNTDRATLDTIIQTVGEQGKWIGELAVFTKAGNQFWAQVAISALTTGYWMVRILDIADRKRAEVDLQEKNEELVRLNAALDRFVYSVSHDLRAPITSVLGLIQIARLEKDRKMVDHYMGLQEKSLLRLDKFITDILAYSRNSRLEVTPEPIDLPQLVETIFEDLSLATFQPMDIQLSITSDGEAGFASDKYRLSIIVHNLIANAIQYRNPYALEPRVSVRISTCPQEVLLEMEDNGIGIGEKHLDKVFDMFYRGTDLNNGSGLGLYIVKEAVEKLKGTITVTSKVGEGTRFLLKVPNLCNQLAAVRQS